MNGRVYRGSYVKDINDCSKFGKVYEIKKCPLSGDKTDEYDMIYYSIYSSLRKDLKVREKYSWEK